TTLFRSRATPGAPERQGSDRRRRGRALRRVGRGDTVRDESVFEMKEECGVFGIAGHPEAVRLTYYGLHALQHRGQESAGIAATDGGAFRHHRGMGLVTDVCDDDGLRKWSGHTSV